jgi:hypothetical protein
MRSDQKIVEQKIANRLGEHFTDLHNAIQKYRLATTVNRQERLKHSIAFYLFKIRDHQQEAAAISTEHRRSLIFEAQLIIAPHDAEAMKIIRQLNREINQTNDNGYFNGKLSERSLCLSQLSRENIMRDFPWI